MEENKEIEEPCTSPTEKGEEETICTHKKGEKPIPRNGPGEGSSILKDSKPLYQGTVRSRAGSIGLSYFHATEGRGYASLRDGDGVCEFVRGP